MTLRVCEDCTTTYAVGVPRCPHCGSERGYEAGTDPFRGGDMPKITRHGGPTNAGDAAASAPESPPEEPKPEPAPTEAEESSAVPEAESSGTDESAGVPRPGVRAARADWEAYVRSLGVNEETIDGLSKDGLIETADGIFAGSLTIGDAGELVGV